MWPGFFNHNDHWVDNFELDLNYEPQSSLRPGGLGLKVEAGASRSRTGSEEVEQEVGREWLAPESLRTCDLQSCNSKQLADSRQAP